MARVDTATARVVGTVTVIGTLLTGLAVLTAGLPAAGGAARDLATAAVITAALAVACALAAQVLTISRGLNPYNLTEVKAWYHRRIETRAYPTQAATILLIVAALLAGAAATLALTAAPAAQPTVSVTQAIEPAGPASTLTGDRATTVTVHISFRDLAPGQVATVTMARPGASRSLASTAVTPAPDGTATADLTVSQVQPAEPVVVDATAGNQHCRATLGPTSRPAPSCRTG